MSYAAALSEHPLASHATGEVVGEVCESLGTRPDLAVVFVSGSHADHIEEIVTTINDVLAPLRLVGGTAVSLVGGGREVEERPAVSLWAARLGTVPPAVHLETLSTPEGVAVAGLPLEATTGGGTLLLIADPFSFPGEAFVSSLRDDDAARLRIVGGLASGAVRPGGNRLVLDDAIHTAGAVGALLPPDLRIDTVVSQGCRPVGSPFIVTAAERNVIHELAGRPALERLRTLIDESDDDERELIGRGLHVGLVIDESKVEFRRGDFLVRGVVGADEAVGSVTVGALVEVGSTVQFHVRDAVTADEDLRELMDDRPRTEAALVFTCNGRGSHLFGVENHDAAVVSEALRGGPVAGMFCAGEFGPVGGANFVHGFTASVVLFGR